MNSTIIKMVIFLHDLFTVVWIGGLLFITLTLLPVLKKTLGHSAESEKVMDSVMGNHSRWVMLSIVGLTITGVLLSRSSDMVKGLFQFDSAYTVLLSLKHTLVLSMVVLTFFRRLRFRNLEKTEAISRKKISLALISINTILGVAVLVISALLAAS